MCPQASQTEYDAEDGEEDEEEERMSDYDDGDGDDEHDGSISDSDDNEKAWGGSYDGSSNHDSISGETSGDNGTSTESHVSGLPSAPSSSGSGSGSASSGSNSDSRGGRDNSSGCNSSGSGGDCDGSGNERESGDADADADWNSKGDDETRPPVSRVKSSATKKANSALPTESASSSAGAARRAHPPTSCGVLETAAATATATGAAAAWTSSKKAKYHHLHSAPRQSVESYRHGATSLDNTTSAKRVEAHLGGDAVADAAFLVHTLQQPQLLADRRCVPPRPPSVSSIIFTTEVTDSVAASMSSSSRGFQSIASSSTSSRATSMSSTMSSSMSSSQSGGIISAQEVTATLAAVAADYMLDIGSTTYYNVKHTSSPSWPLSMMCPVPITLQDVRTVPKIVLAVIPTLAPAPADGGFSPRGGFSPNATVTTSSAGVGPSAELPVATTGVALVDESSSSEGVIPPPI